MSQRHRNNKRAQDEARDALSEASLHQEDPGLMAPPEGPENKQGLKNELWTRIIRVGVDEPGATRLHPILPDMVAFREHPPDAVRPGKKPWSLLFDNEACKKKYKGKTLEQVVLKEQKILELAQLITDLREGLRGAAAAVASTQSQRPLHEEEDLEQLAARVSRHHYPLKGRQRRRRTQEGLQDVCPGLRRRRRRQQRLTLDEKIAIAHRVIVSCESQMDLAQEFRVSGAVVSALITKLRRRPELLADAISEAHEKQHLDLRLAEFIEAQLRQGVQIRTVKQVRDDYEAATMIEYKEHQVRKVMKEQLGLSYKSIVRLAPKTNSIENLICRQQSALVFLKLYKTKRRFIDIDETWLDSVRYQRRCWQPRGGAPGEKQLVISPRISLIAGIDSLGEVFVSLLQANNDTETMEIFLTQLVETLDGEDKHWRKDTVIIWDNATYHTSNGTKSLLETLKIPLLQLGPYSYDMAPAELLFARLKGGDLTPGQVAVGKKVSAPSHSHPCRTLPM